MALSARISRRRPLAGALALTLAGALATPALAETGDYTYWDTLRHLFKPAPADRPVTPAEREGEYPLVSNPEGFDDGFRPGRYNRWQTVKLAPETGAVCGNGSDYKFFVNRVADTSNTLVYFEPGGACWDYPSCAGQEGLLGARNPNGVPDDYMSFAHPDVLLMSPFFVRLHPTDRVKTQDWNLVFVPYCTGDIHSGDKVAVYEDPAGENEPLVWHHNGVRNTRAVTAWLRDNLPRPGQMLSTGCSAGGAAAVTNYFPLRRDLAPDLGFMINDSGPIYVAPQGGDTDQYPSIPLHNKIRDAWGLDGAGQPLDYLSQRIAGFDTTNLGTLFPALASAFPNDRMGYTHFWQDLNYSEYSYRRFYEDTLNAPDRAALDQLLHERWYVDTRNLIQTLSGVDNFGYFLPYFRDFNSSHCTTVLEWGAADIQEQNLEMKDFIRNVLNGKGAVMQASESDTQADYNKPPNPLYNLLEN